MLDRIPRSRHLVGFKQACHAIKGKQVSTVLLASDCDASIKNQVIELCKSEGVDYLEMYTMEKLGEACDIDVGASVVVLLRN